MNREVTGGIPVTESETDMFSSILPLREKRNKTKQNKSSFLGFPHYFSQKMVALSHGGKHDE